MGEGNKYIAGYLKDTYKRLYSYFGPQHWWPADSPFEVIIGAILTQNTAWSNVEKAIVCLKKKRLLSPEKLYNTKLKTLSGVIRPCGYYNLKAARIRSFLEVLFADFKGSLPLMFSLRPVQLRERLLEIKGIGPETADSILLYAAEKPKFVIDAYTRRFLFRHKLIKRKSSYGQIQNLFEENLRPRLKMFNEYHALIVRLAKEFCRSRPLCKSCPLRENGNIAKGV